MQKEVSRRDVDLIMVRQRTTRFGHVDILVIVIKYMFVIHSKHIHILGTILVKYGRSG